MLSEIRKNQLSDKTTVGIFKTGRTYQIRIVPDMQIPEMATGNEKQQLVHSRSFPELLEALGYYMVLNKLSKKSIERLVYSL